MMTVDNTLMNRFVKVAACGVGVATTLGAGYLAWKTGASMEGLHLSLEKICGMRRWPEPGNPTGAFITQTSMALASARIAMGISGKFIEYARDVANKHFPAKIDRLDIEIRKAINALRKSDIAVVTLGAGTAIGMPLVSYGATKAGIPATDGLSTIAGTGFGMVAAATTWVGLLLVSMGLDVAGDAATRKHNLDQMHALRDEDQVFSYHQRERVKAAPANIIA